MVPRALLDLSTLASGLVAKNSALRETTGGSFDTPTQQDISTLGAYKAKERSTPV